MENNESRTNTVLNRAISTAKTHTSMDSDAFREFSLLKYLQTGILYGQWILTSDHEFTKEG